MDKLKVHIATEIYAKPPEKWNNLEKNFMKENLHLNDNPDGPQTVDDVKKIRDMASSMAKNKNLEAYRTKPGSGGVANPFAAPPDEAIAPTELQIQENMLDAMKMMYYNIKPEQMMAYTAILGGNGASSVLDQGIENIDIGVIPNDVLKAIKQPHKVGDIINTPKGKVKVVDFDDDGTPIIDLIQ